MGDVADRRWFGRGLDDEDLAGEQAARSSRQFQCESIPAAQRAERRAARSLSFELGEERDVVVCRGAVASGTPGANGTSWTLLAAPTCALSTRRFRTARRAAGHPRSTLPRHIAGHRAAHHRPSLTDGPTAHFAGIARVGFDMKSAIIGSLATTATAGALEHSSSAGQVVVEQAAADAAQHVERHERHGGTLPTRRPQAGERVEVGRRLAAVTSSPSRTQSTPSSVSGVSSGRP